MKPIIIDVVGTIKELAKWALTQVLLFLGVIFFALSAPFLFTVGALWLAVRYAEVRRDMGSNLSGSSGLRSLAASGCRLSLTSLIGFPTGRFAGRVVASHAATSPVLVKGLGFMISGFFGSLLAESVFHLRRAPLGRDTPPWFSSSPWLRSPCSRLA